MIPIEPASGADVEALSGRIADLVRQIQHTGNRVVIHAQTFEELAKDRDQVRRELRLTLAAKYARIENTLEPGEDLFDLFSSATTNEHDAFEFTAWRRPRHREA